MPCAASVSASVDLGLAIFDKPHAVMFNRNYSYFQARTMYICVCSGVTDHDVQCAVDEGCDSLDALAARTGCASTCGCCREYASEAIAQARSRTLDLAVMT